MTTTRWKPFFKGLDAVANKAYGVAASAGQRVKQGVKNLATVKRGLGNPESQGAIRRREVEKLKEGR